MWPLGYSWMTPELGWIPQRLPAKSQKDILAEKWEGKNSPKVVTKLLDQAVEEEDRPEVAKAQFCSDVTLGLPGAQGRAALVKTETAAPGEL